MTTVAIYQPRFAPHLHWWNRMLQSDVFVIYDDAQFKRQSWQHRCEVMQGGRRLLVTLPISHQDLFKPINQVHVASGRRWREKLLKTLHFSYGGRSFYQRHRDQIETCLGSDLLAEINTSLIRHVGEELDLDVETPMSSSLGIPGGGTERLVDICRHFDADEYLCGGTAYEGYMELDRFREAGIAVRVQRWRCGYPHGNISIIDPLMREGKEARRWIV